MANQTQKIKCIPQLIPEIKQTHHFTLFWACPGMPDRTHLK